jgi:hypothetical protein
VEFDLHFHSFSQYGLNLNSKHPDKATMTKILILLVIFTASFSSLQSQSTTDQTKTDFSDLSRSEIRQEFLNMNESSEYYKLALSSRKSNRQSIASFSIGGLFVVGGFYGLIEGSNRKFGLEQLGVNLLAITSLGVSVPFIIHGVKENKESNEYLDEAIESFNAE